MMDAIKSFMPPEVGEDEHIIRRLGWAIVCQWATLPEEIKERIREQAVYTEDRHKTVQLNEQIKAFIRKHVEADNAHRA